MKLSPFQQQKLKERTLIVKAAGEIFIKKGYNGLSIKSLTNKLNIPKSNFYTHFESKRDLFFAFKTTEYQNFHLELKKFLQTQQCSFKELMFRLLNYFIDYAISDFNRFQIIFATEPPFGDKIGPVERKFNSQPNIVFGEIIELFLTGIKAKILKPIDPVKTAYYVWAIVFGNIQTINRIKSGNLGDNITYHAFAIEEIKKYLENLLL